MVVDKKSKNSLVIIIIIIRKILSVNSSSSMQSIVGYTTLLSLQEMHPQNRLKVSMHFKVAFRICLTFSEIGQTVRNGMTSATLYWALNWGTAPTGPATNHTAFLTYCALFCCVRLKTFSHSIDTFSFHPTAVCCLHCAAPLHLSATPSSPTQRWTSP